MSSKTWFFDIDGTLVRHLQNDEILSEAEEQLLPQVEEFVNRLYHSGDYIILTTARWESQRSQTVKMLENFKLNYHHLIMGIGSGERILVNDIKPIDTEDNFREEVQPTAYAINVERNSGFENMLLHEFWKKPFNSMERVWEMFQTRPKFTPAELYLEMWYSDQISIPDWFEILEDRLDVKEMYMKRYLD